MSWPVFLLSLLLLIMGAGSAWYVNHLYQDLSRVLELNVASVRAAEELEIGLHEIRTQLNDYIHGNSDISAQDIPRLFESTDRWLAEAERLATTQTEQKIIEQLKKGYQHFFESMNQLIETKDDDRGLRRGFRPLINEIMTKEIIEPAHAYLDYNEATMLAVAQEHKIFSKRIANGLMIIAICGSIGGFGAGILVARRMTRSLVELNLPLTMAAGKLSEIVGPIRISTGLNLGELKSILDIIAVEVEQVVMRLQQTQEDILQSEKLAAIGQLAAGTAHELRNPLMSIKLLIQAALLRDDVLQKADLNMMEQELTRVERTIQNLLDFARQPAMSMEPIQPLRLVDQCIRLVQGRAQIQGVSIHTEVEGEPLSLHGDPSQLTQVILNILMNSLDATSQGDEIKLILSTQGQEGIKFMAQDSGRGIQPELLPKIFDPFVSDKESGTGLGLSICKQIIEAHHGEMFALNRQTKGAIVGFYLPVG
ncbi:MAG TPA: ATP-binding protein [Oligoflexus sp.]|uniref:sensor histidine kinase n=1 Tax=Oligoflexus sp. TaxID=1971216 RepID=UPI002D3CF1AD|nr:ATP-binding protein [Oligoflexus sp.]HYX36171.1 ATP-binding protein [Oligoflexus sp.]